MHILYEIIDIHTYTCLVHQYIVNIGVNNQIQNRGVDVRKRKKEKRYSTQLIFSSSKCQKYT